ncbi:sugar ABC transporter substrate-binding protein [Microbacterium sp. EST19A]|uniref:sugar ABC transporter substrate-binding protein n=1 Tax=Microbacterium sp. EST19A TaxID=2862681 RepID=UPI001CBB7238|nr:sugar ABC transporter substrate-binding protein [Microbacterium sp. EST19A]
MKRHVAAIAGLAVAALALSSCATSDAGSTDSEDASGTVRLLGPEDPKVFAPVIAAFEDGHPDITVEYSQVPFDQYATTLQQRLSAEDDTIDVFAVDQPNLAQIAAQGFLEDLSALQSEAKDATSAAQYEINVYDGKMYALSIWNSTQMLFYNKDLLAAAGVEAPSVDPAERWTWEQTAEAGRAAQAAGAESGLLLEQVEAYYQLQPLIESAGGGSGISGPDMLDVDVTDEGWEKALSWYADSFESGLSPRGVGGFQTSAVFTDQKVAFFVGGPWDVGGFAANATFDWGVAPQPYFEGGAEVTPTGSWSWGINTASKNKAAAQEFLEFAALDPAGNLATTEATTIIPANTEAAAEYLPGLEELAGEHGAGVADLITSEIDDTAVARPVSVGYVQFESLINKAFADIRNGADPAERLEQAQSQIEDAWSQLQ